MTVDLGTLDQETTDCLQRRVDAFNASAASPVTPAQFLALHLNGVLAEYRRADYDAALREMGEAAAALPYADRQALMAQIRSLTGA